MSRFRYFSACNTSWVPASQTSSNPCQTWSF